MTICHRFDDFLDDELSPAQRSEFLNHLSACSDCSRELEAQRRFDRMIATVRSGTSDLNARAVDCVESHVRSRIRRIRLANATKAVAAMVVIGLGLWTIYVRSSALNTPEDTVADTPSDAPAAEDSRNETAGRPKVVVDVADDSPYLPVLVENENSEITIIWFHPTIDSRKPEPSSGIILDPQYVIARRT